MAATRQRRTNFSFLLAMIFGVILCLFSVAALAADSQPAPSSGSELICHTTDPSECYPRTFQPTEEFQTVHNDQEVPPGLHIRLNIWTGQKEAKINVPGEIDPALEGLPIDQAIVVVDPEQPDTPPMPKGAPEYESVGKIKEPQPETQDAHSFHEAFKLVKNGAVLGEEAFDDALAALEDISHDIYYGMKITEDPEVLKGMFCIMGDKNLPVVEGFTPRDQQAAAILAGALQNNPTALKEVTKNWSMLMKTPCAKDEPAIGRRFYSSIVYPGKVDPAESAQAAGKAKAKVSAINGLIKSDSIRADFLKQDGMRLLLEVLIPEGKEWAGAQRKVGQLALDNFLDEEMGAKLGQWPRAVRLSDKQCQSAESQTQDGCWDYQVERIMKANKGDKGHWSRDLHDRLAAVRKANAKADAKASRKSEL